MVNGSGVSRDISAFSTRLRNTSGDYKYSHPEPAVNEIVGKTRDTSTAIQKGTAIAGSPQFILKLEVALFPHVLGLLHELPPGGFERFGQGPLGNLAQDGERLQRDVPVSGSKPGPASGARAETARPSAEGSRASPVAASPQAFCAEERLDQVDPIRLGRLPARRASGSTCCKQPGRPRPRPAPDADASRAAPPPRHPPST